MSAETSENIPNNSLQLADDYTSKAEHENLQQVVHTLENSLQKQITDLQEQLGSTRSSLKVKDTELQTLKISMWKDMEKLQEKVDGLQSNNENQVSDIEKLQST